MRPIHLVGVAALALVCALLITPARSALAFDDFCGDDPIVSLNGHVVSIITGVYGRPEDVRRNVRAAHVTIFVPEGTETRVLKTTSVYFQEHVRFQHVGRGFFAARGLDVDDDRDRDRDRNLPWLQQRPRPAAGIPVVVMVEWDASAHMRTAMFITYRGGRHQDAGTTHGRLMNAFIVR
jgi:hypothetical protein